MKNAWMLVLAICELSIISSLPCRAQLQMLDQVLYGGSGDQQGTSISMGSDLVFEPFQILPLPNCQDVAVGDFNGDGIPDIAASANVGSYPTNPSRIFVFLGLGNCQFAPPSECDPGPGCWTSGGLECADLNNDLMPDLLMAHGGSNAYCFGNKVSAHLGDGAGGFSCPGRVLSTGGSIARFVMGDFDEDGCLDFAIPAGDQHALFVHFGNCDGTFNLGSITSLIGACLLAKDLDGDGHVDIAGAFPSEPAIKILSGTGTGVFTGPVVIPAPPGWGITSGDFNEDGLTDLATTSRTPEPRVNIFLATGALTYAPPLSFPVGPEPQSMAPGDYDGDGHLDIAVASYSFFDTLQVLLGDGNGNLSSPIGFAVGGGAGRRVRSVDLNNDGRLDLVAMSVAPQGVCILCNATPLQLALDLDIKPHSCPNPLNVKFGSPPPGNALLKKGGVLPVALLGTDEFDVHDVDVSTVLLEGVSPLRWDYEDVSTPVMGGEACECTDAGADGWIDLTLKFQKYDIIKALGPVANQEVKTLTMTGLLLDGTQFEASDCVVIIKREDDSPDIELTGGGEPLWISPNPFNPVTRIKFALAQDDFVRVSVYDVGGNLIARLVEGVSTSGKHTVEWDASGLASGAYFVRLETGTIDETKKVILLK